jgi:hypothetical protein
MGTSIPAELVAISIVASVLWTAHIPPSRQLSYQLIELPLRVFQIGGIEAFGEPVIDLS